MTAVSTKTLPSTKLLQVQYRPESVETNPLLAIVILLAHKLNDNQNLTMADLKSETLDATGWGLLYALAGCDDLDLPVMGSEFQIHGTLDVVSFDNTSYLELL